MLLEFLSHALAFDLAWIASLLLNNLLWVFILLAYVVIASNGKHGFKNFVILTLLLYAAVELEQLQGLIFVPLLIFIPLNFVLEIFLKDTSLEKHQLKIIIFLFFSVTFLHTFFFRLPG
jgi:hypothetical protein